MTDFLHTIRATAQAEARVGISKTIVHPVPNIPVDLTAIQRDRFVDGAVWLASRLTRENIALAILMVTQDPTVPPQYAWASQYDEVREELLAQADAVLALLR